MDTDVRIPQAKKIMEAILSKSELLEANCIITETNVLVIVLKETVLYMIQLIDLPVLPAIGFEYETITDDGQYEFSFRNLSFVGYLCQDYIPKINIQPMVYVENARSIPEFERLLNRKADDGMEFYVIRGLQGISRPYHIPIFTRFPNINKNDTIDISLYPYNEISYIVKMDIFKKKINKVVSMIYRTLYLQ